MEDDDEEETFKLRSERTKKIKTLILLLHFLIVVFLLIEMTMDIIQLRISIMEEALSILLAKRRRLLLCLKNLVIDL